MTQMLPDEPPIMPRDEAATAHQPERESPWLAAERKIARGEHLARRAEQYMKAVDEYLQFQEGEGEASRREIIAELDRVIDAERALNEAIYQFRKPRTAA